MIKALIRLLRYRPCKDFRQIFLKMTNENTGILGIGYTLYFQVAGEETFIPIDIPYSVGKTIEDIQNGGFQIRPNIFNTFRRVVLCLGGTPTAILVAMYSEGIYYTQIQIKKGDKVFEIDAQFTDAISVAIECKIPIYAERNLCEIFGINLGKEPYFRDT